MTGIHNLYKPILSIEERSHRWSKYHLLQCTFSRIRM